MTFKQFRRLCLALPQAEERETWGEATFRVKDRIFAMGSPDGEFVSVKATPDDQAALVEMDPKTFAPSPAAQPTQRSCEGPPPRHSAQSWGRAAYPPPLPRRCGTRRAAGTPQ